MNQEPSNKIDFVRQASAIERVLQLAVVRELSIHKQLGNPIAVWENGEVVIIPPNEIIVSLREHTEHQELPEYLRVLIVRYPNHSDYLFVLDNIRSSIDHYQTDNKHNEVIVNQCHLGWEVFNSVQFLVGYDYGLSAMAQCRNLFEMVLGAIFLIENPHKLEDFLHYGTIVDNSTEHSQKYVKALKKDKELPTAGDEKWHGQRISKLAIQAGLQDIYESFYKECSSIAHGDPSITLAREGMRFQLINDARTRKNYSEAALAFSLVCIASLYKNAVQTLRLFPANDIEQLEKQLLNSLVQKTR